MRPNCVEMNLKLMAFEQLCRGPYLLRGLFLVTSNTNQVDLSAEGQAKQQEHVHGPRRLEGAIVANDHTIICPHLCRRHDDGPRVVPNEPSHHLGRVVLRLEVEVGTSAGHNEVMPLGLCFDRFCRYALSLDDLKAYIRFVASSSERLQYRFEDVSDLPKLDLVAVGLEWSSTNRNGLGRFDPGSIDNTDTCQSCRGALRHIDREFLRHLAFR